MFWLFCHPFACRTVVLKDLTLVLNTVNAACSVTRDMIKWSFFYGSREKMWTAVILSAFRILHVHFLLFSVQYCRMRCQMVHLSTGVTCHLVVLFSLLFHYGNLILWQYQRTKPAQLMSSSSKAQPPIKRNSMLATCPNNSQESFSW